MDIKGKFWDGYLTIAATDYSGQIKSATLHYGHENIDLTVMGNATKVNGVGIKQWSLDVEFATDLTDDALDEDLYDLVGNTTPVAIAFRFSKTDAISTTNPEFHGNAVLGSDYTIGGAHGALATCSITFVSAGDLTRDTTP